jgi:hypothetical protein
MSLRVDIDYVCHGDGEDQIGHVGMFLNGQGRYAVLWETMNREGSDTAECDDNDDDDDDDEDVTVPATNVKQRALPAMDENVDSDDVFINPPPE